MGKLAKIKAIDNIIESAKNSRFKFYSKDDTYKIENRNLLTEHDCIDFTDYSAENIIKTLGKRVAIDLETTGINYLENEIVILGFSDGNTHGYINLDLNDGFNTTYNLLKYFEEYAYDCIAFNLQFENAFITNHFGIELNWVDDPQLQAYLFLNKPYPKLSELSSEYLNRHPKSLEEISGQKFSKDIFYNPEYRNNICIYCCEDCYETLLLADKLPKSELYHIDLKSTLVASKMKLKGIRIDQSLLSSLPSKIKDYIEIISDEIETIAGWMPNLKSPQQMNKLLFEQLQLDSSELKPNKSGFSIDAKARQILLEQHPIIQKIDNVIKALDIKNKYVKSLGKQIYLGKIHTTFNTIVTATGRLSSSNPNLQQIPNPDKYASYGNKFLATLGKDIRNLFIADEGHVLVACDFSSFELRILADLCQDPTLLEVFKQNNSLHNVMTEKLFGITYDKNNHDHKAKRTVVKTINFGLIYGMTYLRLYEECKLRKMNWSKKDCKNIIQQYWEMLPVLAEWFAALKVKAIQNGYTTTMFGRRRYYNFSTEAIKSCEGKKPNLRTYQKLKLTPSDESQLRQAGNAVIQGTNADAIRISMEKCNNIKGIELLLQIHDELIFQVPKGLENYAKAQIKQNMEASINLSVPVIAEPVVATKWGECK